MSTGKRGFNKGSIGAKPGLEIWRIEKLEAVLQDPSTYGSFFAGDCYLVLHTKEENNRRSYDLFYWLGSECSQDEKGTVAYKAVELDDLLGGKPVQHREVQGHESAAFLALFPKGIRIQAGGVESGFNKVDPNAYTPRLLHLKGKRNVRVTQVELKSSSLNEGDVFILDLGLTLYQWNGSQANKFEKFKGLEMVTTIKDKERGGRAKTIFLDSGRAGDDEGFWKVLGDKSAVKDAAAGGDDDDHHTLQPAELFQISDASGKMEVTSVAKGRLERKMLDENDVFLLDTGAELFVWVGKGATKDERSKGMSFATQYLEEKKRPDWTPITRIVGGGETPVFKSFFGVWEMAAPRTLEEKKAGKPVVRPPDVEALHKQVQQAEEKMADDGSGNIEIWRIEDFKQVPVDKEEYGQFFAGDSYILLYSYTFHGKDAWIIYFWQGRDSSMDEKGAAALLTVELDKKLGGAPAQVRVVQGKEPDHFLQLFKGRMIVRSGGRPSGFKNKTDADAADDDSVALFHIKGTNERNTRAVQVDAKALSLNSGDCFALVVPNTLYVWAGKGANDLERKTAASIAGILKGGRSLVNIDEGSEPEAFWDALGGKTEYVEFSETADELKQPRLFHCSENSGAFQVEEVFNFAQEDLIPDDVMILDVYKEVYVWVGKDARREEKDSSLRLALNYVDKAPDGRDPDTPVFKVEQGFEPPTFTCHFLGWDPKKFADSDPYSKRMEELKAAAAAAGTGPLSPLSPGHRVTAADIGYADPAAKSYTLEELKSGAGHNVDPARKEYYLSDADFQTHLKMDKEAWSKVPAWKRTQAKKALGIF